MARCAETVLRGGAIIFLLNTVNHLQQIATIEMVLSFILMSFHSKTSDYEDL